MKLFKVLTFFLCIGIFGQDGFKISHPAKTVIPFQLINNLIFVPVNINGVDLTFLLDSGVNETLLFSLEDKEINFNDIAKIKFSGLGENRDVEGLRSDNNIIRIGKDFKDLKQTVFIILDESINFSSHVGIPVNGIIGFQFFENHPVQIDYISKKITVFNDEKRFRQRLKRFTPFPITLEANKPYLQAGIELTDHKADSKMLLDLGNSDAVWLFPKLIKDFVYNRPNIDDYLGQGFNGDIFGKRSRIHQLYIGDFVFDKPLAAMPDEYSLQNLRLVPDRKGSVGNEILRRFTIIFNYPEKTLYLKKNKDFDDPFLINKSGLDIQHDGMTWEKDIVRVETTPRQTETAGEPVYAAEQSFKYNFILKPQYSIAGCRKDSPCFTAGIRKGDRIIKINRKKAGEYTLQKITDLLKQPDGTKVTFEIERDGKTSIFVLTLIDPIPYRNGN
ncbi:retropepsin-like aspartic protease [Kaistella palustris]|uniref:retropepsin-like aspartic protease n=1 Tax=Kaistella palustris TaxID=493376 RepID=UPI000408F920|nr:aspartyl protease family protein [Kaistella palustris]